MYPTLGFCASVASPAPTGTDSMNAMLLSEHHLHVSLLKKNDLVFTYMPME